MTRWHKRLLLLSGLFWLGVAALALTAERWGPSVFVAAVDAWLLDEPPFEADAILVLAGNTDARVASAARLYHEGWASKILLTRVDPAYESEAPLDPAVAPASLAGSTQQQLRLLQRRHGVPSEAIEVVDGPIPITSTYSEALAVSEWIRSAFPDGLDTPRRLLFTTDGFHTRRAKWIIRHVLADETLSCGEHGQTHVRAVASDDDSGAARLAQLRRQRAEVARAGAQAAPSVSDELALLATGYPIFREWSKAAVYFAAY
ncbi:hypothetical protein ASA1KI_42970 [Opitutales bacterium ASA1]|uniref:YdcF family protein n=1 Tax=Congregicoccus parvus TaxID=3081749 RepID=UPI002B2DF7A1|nr:hypothetical protein ASA1KI_42970 [Opitutales bacterium ASA1]